MLQLGGASGFGYLSVAQREATNAILNKKGEFRKGLYYWKDENGNEQSMDGSDACFEHATGRKLQFAEPRYTDVIAMNPDAFDWLPEGSEGVSVKWLGTFTERNMRIGFVRLDANAVFGAGQHPSLQVLYLTKADSPLAMMNMALRPALNCWQTKVPSPCARSSQPSCFVWSSRNSKDDSRAVSIAPRAVSTS